MDPLTLAKMFACMSCTVFSFKFVESMRRDYKIHKKTMIEYEEWKKQLDSRQPLD